MNTRGPMIEVQDLVKQFGKFTAVDQVSLSIGAGEFFGFLGPNGAGKTTTIRMMAGLLAPTSGRCTLHGFDVQTSPMEAKRSLAFVPDQPFLYERLTGREFLHFLGGIFEMDGAAFRTALDDVTTAFDVGGFLDQRMEEYSQGMRQRMVLAGALLHRPSVLIIDEPLIGLDPRSANLVKQTLKTRSKEGLTIFMSTHLLDIVEELCDRLAIIHHGRIVHQQTLADDDRTIGRLEPLFLDLTR